MSAHLPTDSDNDDQIAYIEPEPDADVWPADWTPKQKENWLEHGQPQYERLETDQGREWFRRCYRPRKRGSGLLETDRVQLGNPEDYIIEMIDDYLDPWGSMTSVMMRKISSYSVGQDVLDDVVDEFLKAKLEGMSDEQVHRLASEHTKVAQLYGLDVDQEGEA